MMKWYVMAVADDKLKGKWKAVNFSMEDAERFETHCVLIEQPSQHAAWAYVTNNNTDAMLERTQAVLDQHKQYLKQQIDKVKSNPIPAALSGLRLGGHDEFSNLKTWELIQKCDAKDSDKMIKEMGPFGISWINMCHRWHLRGLSVDLAIKKMHADIQQNNKYSEKKIEKTDFNFDEFKEFQTGKAGKQMAVV